MKPIPMECFQFYENLHFEENNPFNEFACKVGARVVDRINEELVNAIIDHARKEGFTHLYLLDKTFIANALKHELERWEKENNG